MHDLSASNVTKGLGSDEWHSIRKQLLASFKARLCYRGVLVRFGSHWCSRLLSSMLGPGTWVRRARIKIDTFSATILSESFQNSCVV